MKVNVTTMEVFRRYLDGEASEEDVLASLEGRVVETEYMRIGTALHKIFAEPEGKLDMEACVFRVDNYAFGVDLINKINWELVEIGFKRWLMAFEVPVEKRYNDILVVGRVDGLYGDWLVDLKVTWKPKRYEDFYHSVQWKFYTDILQAKRFFYLVVEINDKLGASVYSFDFEPTKTLTKELESLCRDFQIMLPRIKKVVEQKGGAK